MPVLAGKSGTNRRTSTGKKFRTVLPHGNVGTRNQPRPRSRQGQRRHQPHPENRKLNPQRFQSLRIGQGAHPVIDPRTRLARWPRQMEAAGQQNGSAIITMQKNRRTTSSATRRRGPRGNNEGGEGVVRCNFFGSAVKSGGIEFAMRKDDPIGYCRACVPAHKREDRRLRWCIRVVAHIGE